MIKKIILIQCDCCTVCLSCFIEEDYKTVMRVYGWEEINEKQYCTKCVPKIKEALKRLTSASRN